jgi:hypothetical protein
VSRLSFTDALDQALELLEQGHPLEYCVRQFPEYADELRPLLQVSADLQRLADSAIPSFTKATVEPDWDAILAEVPQDRPRRFGWAAAITRFLQELQQHPFQRYASLASAIIILVVLLLNGSSNSSPDNPLYYVKRTVEQVEVITTQQPSDRVELHLKLARRRLSELQTLASQNQRIEAPLLQQMIVETRQALDVVTEAQRTDAVDPQVVAQLTAFLTEADRSINQLQEVASNDEILDTAVADIDSLRNNLEVVAEAPTPTPRIPSAAPSAPAASTAPTRPTPTPTAAQVSVEEPGQVVSTATPRTEQPSGTNVSPSPSAAPPRTGAAVVAPSPTRVPSTATAAPTLTPTAVPTQVPTATPEPTPTAAPTSVPTAVPTAVPTPEPTAVPTPEPTAVPTATPEPTAVPTPEPTAVPTATPEPTAVPTEEPTATPSATPAPTSTVEPTTEPSVDPTSISSPTETAPSEVPSETPTDTIQPPTSSTPSTPPISVPTWEITVTIVPPTETTEPAPEPTSVPVVPTSEPTVEAPTETPVESTPAPTAEPTPDATSEPIVTPTAEPTPAPTDPTPETATTTPTETPPVVIAEPTASPVPVEVVVEQQNVTTDTGFVAATATQAETQPSTASAHHTLAIVETAVWHTPSEVVAAEVDRLVWLEQITVEVVPSVPEQNSE